METMSGEERSCLTADETGQRHKKSAGFNWCQIDQNPKRWNTIRGFHEND